MNQNPSDKVLEKQIDGHEKEGWGSMPRENTDPKDEFETNEREEKERNLETQLSNAMEMALLGHWEYDVEKDLFTFNDQFYKIFRTTARQAGGYTMSSAEYASRFVHPLDRHMVGEEVRNSVTASNDRFNRQIEHRILYADGETGYISVRYFVVKDARGRTVRTYGVNQDITRHKKAEQAIRDAEAKWRNILVNVPQIGISLDREEKIVFANEYFLKLTGWKNDEVIGQNWFDLFIPETIRNEVRDIFSTVMLHKDPLGFYTYENEILDRSGNLLNVGWSNVPTKDAEGNVVDVTCLGVDLTERRRAEKKLKESEAKYRTILKSAMDGFLLIDTEGKILEVNDAYCAMSAYSRDELLTMHIGELEYNENPGMVSEHIQKVIERGADRFESRHQRKDGTLFDIEVSVQYRAAEGGQCICFMRDISRQKQSFEAIRSVNEKMRLAAESAHFGIWDFNISKGRLEWDDWMFQLFGLSRDRFSGTVSDWREMIHPDDLERTVREHEQVFNSNKILDTEYRIVRPDGGVRHIKAHGTVTRDRNGTPLHMTGVNYDITDQKKYEQALRESEDRFKALHNASFGGIVIHDNGLILECNRGLTEITGYGYEELIGMDGLLLISEDTRDKVSRNIESGYEKPYEAIGIRKNGEKYPLRLEARIIPYKGKNVRVVEFRDISEIKRAEQERFDLEEKLRQAQKMESIGNLAGGIAHDFNNILFPIIGLSELLMEELPRSSIEHENVGEILKAGMRGSDLVKQILAFSRQSEHKMMPTRVQNIIREVLKLSRSTIPSNIEIRQDINSDCGLIIADPTQIHQVTMNIITNAYHAVSPDSGEIAVSLSERILDQSAASWTALEPGPYAVITVSDTGKGMSGDILKKIFEPYFTTKEQGKGTGLGLAVVHGIVKEHKGDIRVRSEIGKGSTFEVYLPLMEKSAPDEPLHRYRDPPTGNERILLVDDEESITRLGRRMLERLGYRVNDMTSSPDALEAFRADPHRFDLVISDMSMPNMTGDMLAEEMKRIRPEIPVIICTGFSERINEEKAEALGLDGLLMKPILTYELAVMVRKVLDNIRKTAPKK